MKTIKLLYKGDTYYKLDNSWYILGLIPNYSKGDLLLLDTLDYKSLISNLDKEAKP